MTTCQASWTSRTNHHRPNHRPSHQCLTHHLSNQFSLQHLCLCLCLCLCRCRPAPIPPPAQLPAPVLLPALLPTPDLALPQAMTALLAQLQAPPVAPATAQEPAAAPATCAKIKAHDPDPYDRSDPTKLRAFLSQCKLVFRAHPYDFDEDQVKITYAVSWLKGTAQRWYEPTLALADDNLPDYAINWDDFEEALKTTFSEPDPVSSASYKLDQLVMKDTHHVMSSSTSLPSSLATKNMPFSQCTITASCPISRTPLQSLASQIHSMSFVQRLRCSTCAIGSVGTKIAINLMPLAVPLSNLHPPPPNCPIETIPTPLALVVAIPRLPLHL